MSVTVLTGLFVAAPAIVSAHDKNWDTDITWTSESASRKRIQGTVSSNKENCDGGRTVRIFQIRDNGEETLRGTTTTKADDTFDINPGGSPPYVAEVRPIFLGGGYGHTHSCSGARSRVLRKGDG